MPETMQYAQALPRLNVDQLRCHQPSSTPACFSPHITIPGTWVLPGGTKLIGEGSQNPLSPILNRLPGATIIQACTSTISGCNGTNFSGPMLQFGAPTCPGQQCTGIVKGISVENVLLNGNGLSITGIQNGWAQELTYVDHVSLFQILGMGLQVRSSALRARALDSWRFLDLRNRLVPKWKCPAICLIFILDFPARCQLIM
jgi:hypothetical protein